MFTVGYTISALLKWLRCSDPSPQSGPSNVLLATQLPSWIIKEESREVFEDLFSVYDNDVIINYIPSCSSARITFSDIDCAVACKKELSGLQIDGENKLKLSYTSLGYIDKQHLELPAATKQFLISPPSSPPVGWEPVVEMEPHVDETLIAAIEKLGGHNLSGEELMLIPEEAASPAITLKMSIDNTAKQGEDLENEQPPAGNGNGNVTVTTPIKIIQK